MTRRPQGEREDAMRDEEANPLLQKAVDDRERHPWRYYKLEHDVMKRLLDELSAKLDAAEAALKGQMWQREAKEETVPNNDVIQYMLDSLEAPMKPLTKWETDFLESIGDQFKMRGSLTVRQAEILERIYNEKK